MKKLFHTKGFSAFIAMLFLNTFVDLGHKIIIQNTVFKIYDGQTQIILTAIVNGLILLPYIMLFSPAGFISDKYPKTIVMKYSAFIAIGATLLITLAYYQGWFILAFSLTLLMGIQSAIYSPAKYGYIRELLGVKNLANANAAVQAATIVAILGGTVVFSALFEVLLAGITLDSPKTILQNIAVLGWLLAGLSIIEWYLAHRLVQTRTIDQSKGFSVPSYLTGKYLKNNLRAISEREAIWLSIIGLSMFWAVSQMILATFPAFAKEALNETNTLVIQGILASTGIGIVVGSLIAGRISRNYIELGLIPVGAIGFSIILGVIPTLNSQYILAAAFMLIGILGGLFIVPLNALIQYHAKEDKLGTILAGNNWVQNIAMFGFLCITIMFALQGLASVDLLYISTVVAFAGAFYTIYKLPHSLVRIFASCVFRQRYHIAVIGFERLPKTGGVLLLGNHTSWIDGILIQIACPRKVRFVMLRDIYNWWFFKPFLKLLGAIPISPQRHKESLQLVNQALKKGEVVCLFPEGAITRNGAMGVFRTGFEKVVDGVDGSIIPFYLHGLWGSRLSRAKNEKLYSDKMRGMRREVSVTFGAPLSMHTPAATLKQNIFELSHEAWNHQASNMQPLALSWIKRARKNLGKTVVTETTGQTFSNAKLLAVTVGFAKAMHNIDPSKHIGVLLPASSASIIANMATLLNGQVVVNLNFTSSPSAVQAGMDNADIATVYTSKKLIQKLADRGIDTEAMLAGRRVIYLEELVKTVSKPRIALAYLAAYLLPAGTFFACYGRKVSIDDPAAILFSSGSEGTPKGIVLSHRNFMANVKQISDVLNTRDDEVIMGSLPPFHSFGLTVTMLFPLIEGISVVCHPDPTDVLSIAKAVAKHRVTLLCATATFLRFYLKNSKVQPLMLENLRNVIAGAEKLPNEVRQAFKEKFGKDIYEGYGATETTPVASVNIPDCLDINDWTVQIGNKVGTVGMPLPGSSFRIVDPQTLVTLPVEQDGLILISGPQVMTGYLHDAEKTAAAIVELDGRRWYKTGDKGHLDSDGFLTIIDRYSRFAKIGGEMVSLGAVEETLRNAMQDCDQSQPIEGELLAVNLPDSKKGEKIVVLSTAPIAYDQIRQALVDQECNPLMIPTSLYLVDEVPKLGSGKTDFSAAKKLATEMDK